MNVEFSCMSAKDKSTKPGISPRMAAVGEKLRKIRVEKGYSGYDFFAWENKLSPRQYLNMEQGNNFTMNSLIKVLDIHGITLEEFFEGLK